MKALVTGGGGFLGRYIVERLLARGDQVTVLCRRRSPWMEARVSVVQADLQEAAAVKEACRGVEVVFHTAARVGVAGRYRDFYGTNVVGTRNVVQGCLASGVRRLVHTSSPSVFLGAHDVRGADESLAYPRSFLNHYQRTKAEAEQLVLAASGQHGLVTTVLRPHAIWGPRDGHLLPRLLDRARRGRLRIVGEGTNRVSTAYVENVAQAHLLAAASERAAGQAYFICDEEPVVLWEWLNHILDRLGMQRVTRRIPYRVAYAIGAAFDFLYGALPFRGEPPITRYVAAELAKDHYFDTRRARADLGFVPEISREEGVERVVADYLAGARG